MRNLTTAINLASVAVMLAVLIPLVAHFPTIEKQIPKSEKKVPLLADGNKDQPPKSMDGKDLETGFIIDTGYEVTKTTCTACHSAKLVTQNKASREGWKDMIVWMQETQGLWELGKNEDIILDYLAKNYAPVKKGRRKPLEVKEWYVIEDE